MSIRRQPSPPPQPDAGRATADGMRLRFRLSRTDAARLREFQEDDEAPVDTIRRLIRTAAMVLPILEALRAGQAVAAPAVESTPTQPDGLVERQMAAMDAWLKDD